MNAAARVLALSLALGAAACPKTPKVTGHERPVAVGTIVEDPVTKARCERTSATPSAVFSSRTFYFCELANRAEFVAEPERFAATP